MEKEKQGKYSLFDRMERKLKAVHCGMHSGFPLCCIMFQGLVWVYIPSEMKNKINNWRKKVIGDVHPGYIMCPKCVLSKNIVSVVRCDCGAYGWAGHPLENNIPWYNNLA